MTDYERPQAMAGRDAALREMEKLRRSLRSAEDRGDRNAVAYLKRRLATAYATAREHGHISPDNYGSY